VISNCEVLVSMHPHGLDLPASSSIGLDQVLSAVLYTQTTSPFPHASSEVKSAQPTRHNAITATMKATPALRPLHRFTEESNRRTVTFVLWHLGHLCVSRTRLFFRFSSRLILNHK